MKHSSALRKPMSLAVFMLPLAWAGGHGAAMRRHLRPLDRRPAGQQLVDEDSDGVDIAAGIGVTGGDLFGREIGGGAEDYARRGDLGVGDRAPVAPTACVPSEGDHSPEASAAEPSTVCPATGAAPPWVTEILRGLACSATGMVRVRTPSL